MCQNQYENRFWKIVERYRKDIVIELTKIIFTSYKLKCAQRSFSLLINSNAHCIHKLPPRLHNVIRPVLWHVAHTYIIEVGAPQAQCSWRITFDKISIRLSKAPIESHHIRAISTIVETNVIHIIKLHVLNFSSLFRSIKHLQHPSWERNGNWRPGLFVNFSFSV